MGKPTTKERAQLLIESAIEACQSAISAPLFMSDEQVEAARRISRLSRRSTNSSPRSKTTLHCPSTIELGSGYSREDR